MNQLRLSATLVEREALRYTPAGVPVVNCLLQHAGEVVEAQIPRQIEFAIAAMGIGPVGQRLERMPLGTLLDCEGFLARKHRNSKALVFHITGCKAFEKD
ncbi:primosomal replication protein N [Cupriavidus sp. USMAA2-4]|uniref:Replication restart protein PriB n=1 Tax=Cupriavidus malaysiensis TaxID=367825 RepID=A0ABM6F611_9BURK|nr:MULTISPECIES: primosomal replication protein N [Cupriavidus]AOY93595.1 primosomal replication protein N [Cupriavidus sp. USMAA2-4]AOZ00126.1 primosomal replication protein N [Cupriavidus sp. USMAHM13]AOZ06870.1 primosomal replication protein N [Cupriavidus malaysiensis]